MIQLMLNAANLLSQYRSHAIWHTIYIKNRLPHKAPSGYKTPNERYTNIYLDISLIRVFESQVTVKQPHVIHYKIDNEHNTTRIMLGFSVTDRTLWYEDMTSGEIKST